MKALISIVLLSLMFAAGSVCAQSQGPQFPCQDDERFAEFDFWVGEWTVHIADGTYAGSNVITSPQQGCVLLENWTGASGSTGLSINYLDHQTGEWVQIWSDASGSQIDIRGGMTDEGMRMVGTIHYIGSNTTFPFRALWTPLEDGRVRQFFEQYDATSETWAPWFEGFYTRKTADSDNEED